MIFLYYVSETRVENMLIWAAVCGLWCYIGLLMNKNAYLKQKEMKINKFHLFLDFVFILISFDFESCFYFNIKENQFEDELKMIDA